MNKTIKLLGGFTVFTIILSVFLLKPISTESTKGSEREILELTPEQIDSIKLDKKIKQLENRTQQTLSTELLYYAYASNEVNADNDFKGKKFYVKGKIDDIGKDVFGKIYVTLKTN